MSRMTAENTVRKLIEHWTEFGLPNYVQFDKATAPKNDCPGPRTADSLGKTIRFCLSLDVIPVFVPPRETGFQASIENDNGRWERGVWKRFHFENFRAVESQSSKFVKAMRTKNAVRTDGAPDRWEFPNDWELDYQTQPKGKVICIRRSTDRECVEAMGHRWALDRSWPHRLVRAEVDLTQDEISFFRLRRSDPSVHEFLGVAEYHFPKRKFKE